MPKVNYMNSTHSKLLGSLEENSVERYVLPNGMTVILKPDSSSPVSSVQVWVKSGSIHEGRFLGSGLSHFVEHMLFKGTSKRSGREISTTIQAHGGYINAYTTFDRTVYYIDMPSEHTEVAVDLLADTVLHSTLPEEEVEKEKEVILREIDMGQDDPDHQLSQALFETAFREHSYRHPIIGHREVFEMVSRDDLVEYYKTRYVPNNLTVIIVGDFDKERLKASIYEHFGQVPRARIEPVYLPEEPSQLAPRTQALHEDVQITRVAQGYQVPGLSHPDTPALDILSMILGNGDSSIFWQALREEKQLVHSISVTNWTPGSVGLFYISMLCDPGKRDVAMAELRRLIQKVASKGIVEKALQKAVRQVLVGEVNVRKTMSGQASRLGMAEVVVGEMDYARSYLERISSLTCADVKRVAKQYLREDRLTTVTHDPRSSESTNVSMEVRESSNLDFEEFQFENGVRALLRENHQLPNLHIKLICQGGALYEPVEKRGVTALLGTLLTKDTTKRSTSEISDTIESVGGSFSEFSGNNSLGLGIEVLPEDQDLALELLSDAALQPAFKKGTLEHEKTSQLAGLLEDKDDIVTTGRKLLREKFFSKYPLSLGSSGSEETVSTIGVSDVRAHYKNLMVGGNVVLSVSGAFSRKELLPKLRQAFQKIPKGQLNPLPFIYRKKSKSLSCKKKMERQQVIVYQAFPGPGVLSEDFYISDVADELFSGMSSNLFEKVREERGLAYFVRSARVVGLKAGMFYFYAGTNPEGCSGVLEELDREITRVRDGMITREELLRCQIRLKAGKRMGMQTNSACASQAALNAVYGLPVNDWRDYDSHIDRVTVDDLKEFALKRFCPENRVQVLIGAV
jgi:zinc protease